MDNLPERVKAILQDNGTASKDLLCCSHCRKKDQQDDDGDAPPNKELHFVPRKRIFFPCSGCKQAHYCSLRCKNEHAHIHNNLDCSRLGELQQRVDGIRVGQLHEMVDEEWYGSEYGDGEWQSVPHLQLGDQLVQMGFREANNEAAKKQYFQKAIRSYLGCVVDEFLLGMQEAAVVHDRVLLLLIYLGGDAQVMLDIFEMLSKLNTSTNSTFTPGVPSPPSEEQYKHPLLALHGFFEIDRKDVDNDCTLPGLYLLASFRSLVQHNHMKVPFQAYKDITTRSWSAYPQLPDVVLGTISSFIWDSTHAYDYGESLPNEVQRTIFHIQTKTNGGNDFLQILSQSSDTSSAAVAAQRMLASLELTWLNDPPKSFMSSAHGGECSGAAMIPLFWALYQDCFHSSELATGNMLTFDDFCEDHSS